jgi:eukaryotic-like serine/threonine-protein kinase
MKALAPDDPRVIGEYRLRARLGAGGMGRVYLGLSPAGRAVAIKVVNPELAGDAEFLQRFGQEVAAARAVSGIYTAPVVASGLNERPPWLATAFVPGPSLDQMVSEHGPLPEAGLWPLLAGLSEALQAIHACGLVHRDLKPANVLLAADGPRVIDFGISRATDGTKLTAAGVVFGTPGYMSPEQAEGKPAGAASDVFALGCVITYAATGAGPFGTGTAASVLYRVVHGQPVLDGVPPGLREIVSGCLAKDPAARPTLAALAAAVAGRGNGTGPSAVAFWPRPLASMIGDYQAILEQETRTTPVAPGSRVPGPRGYGAAQGYPQPQSYGGAQAPPRGYIAGAPPVNYAPPYQAGRTPARPLGPSGPLPVTMRNAIGLMYSGAAYAAVYAIGVISVAGAVIAKNQTPITGQANPGESAVGGVVFLVVVASLIEIALGLGIARACRNGKSWARVTGTVLFGLHTLGFLGVLANKHPGIGPVKVLTLFGWLIALCAVVFLWQRQSSAFFGAAAARRRPA